MRETTIGGTVRKIDANPFTTIVYERAFGLNHKLHEDVTTFLDTQFGPLTMMPMDAILRLEYALERSVVSIAFPDYDNWLRSFPVEELDQRKAQENGRWVNTLLDEVVETFFPSLRVRADMGAQAAGDEPGTAGRARGEAGAAPAVEGEEG